MRRFVLFILAISCFLAIPGLAQQASNNLKLWYDQPAPNWNEALPIGNGRLGAMVFGVPEKENIQLNEGTLWSGGPHRNDNPDTKAILPEIRQLLFDGKYEEAHNLANAKIISNTSHGMPFETAGNLYLTFDGHDNYSNYYRELDISKAIQKTSYTVDGVNYQREVFTSFPDQVLVIRLTASKPGQLSFAASMDRPNPELITVSTEGNGLLKMVGRSNDRKSKRLPKDAEGTKGQVKFETRVQVIPEGGMVIANDTSLAVEKANSVTIYVSIATNFVNYMDISGDQHERAVDYLAAVEGKSYDQLKQAHTQHYQQLFNRVALDLGRTKEADKPTDARINNFSSVTDPALAALYFQFGRYLLISSSQPGGQPANLQGIWCNQLDPPWKSAYTININTEMNYWPAEVTNLPEMHEPLIEMVKELSVAGQETAEVMYGADGWVAHHNTDLWRIAGPVDGATWGMWPSGGIWLSQHLWDKYMFSGDIGYLREVYPAMKGSTEFCLSFLIPEPEHGWLIMSPSTSPENRPAHFPNMINIQYGTTMDNQLVFDMLTKTAAAARLLGEDDDLVKKIEETIPKLAPMQIGQHGQIQEWIKDWDDPEDKHRHVSHLYGLQPSNQISPYRNPELFEAAMNVLTYRGDPSTGWSMNWKINLWARLLDGNHAYKLMGDQIRLVGRPDSPNGGGTYPNMLDAHPPFQIDGNFGFTSGLAEMLVQSHDGAIHLVPAVPDVWKDGKVTGLRARGGFVIESMAWKDGKLAKAVIKSTLGGNCRIRSYNALTVDGKKSLKKAKGVNKNNFYQTPAIKEPLISAKANLKGYAPPKSFLYDVPTKSGDVIVLVGK
ncbi:glycoside hydrolase N-terminal domain-containing protein [Pontibacter sp. E15-1]|uniref:glycosyl hydrolase family 95 catalytic domain-containing protein n=1 Tax=Pontibacter sp. E15-1 TaxID=2919918 RepID=UPI001F4F4806|nr:glycoside hydrolase N-terminal domain-containing protein [Pontibacter sp. E15-1]MCJ8165740.1 glycoside hydrolase N-terminal domain-containing protein [Pontibacter sp. E15-1]